MALKGLLPSSRSALAFLLLGVALAALRLLGEQGARLGILVFPDIGASWVAGFLVVSALLVPAAAKPIRVRTAIAALLALAALAWPVGSYRAASLRSGRILTGSVLYSSASRNQPERVIAVDLVQSAKRLSLRRATGRARDVALEISGYLYSPDTGEYRIAILSDGETTLRIDGREIDSAPLTLECGIHEIQIQYERGDGAAFLELTWDRPARFELLPAGYFAFGSPSQVDLGTTRRSERASLASASIVLFWWALCACWVIRMGESFSLPAPISLFRKRPVQLFLAATTFLTVLLILLQPKRVDDPFYRETSSEFMMQTVSIADLRDQPLRSLWYLHIQPPLLDGIRALLAAVFSTSADEELLTKVDFALRGVFVLAYALLVALLFAWLTQTTSGRVAMAASIAFALHPGLIFFSTWLDSTLLSTLLVTWFYYELWRTSSSRGSTWRLALSTLLLFFTRSIFQWPFILVVAVSLVLLKLSPRKAAAFVLVVGAVTGSYVAKQYWLFGIPYTSSFAGYNGCRSIGADVSWDTRAVEGRLPRFPSPSKASVLARETKVNGEYNFNQLHYLRISFALMDRYWRTLRSQPFGTTLGVYAENLRIYLRPSSRYQKSPVVDPLPWRELHDLVFSGGVGLLLLIVAAGVGIRQEFPSVLRKGAAMALPALYIAVVSVVFESGENMRFRFFLEPVLWVFIVTQFRSLARRMSKGPGPQGSFPIGIAILP
jgi:hypothetical protein